MCGDKRIEDKTCVIVSAGIHEDAVMEFIANIESYFNEDLSVIYLSKEIKKGYDDNLPLINCEIKILTPVVVAKHSKHKKREYHKRFF